MKGGGVLELPAGFRFHPTDDELVNHYLCKKCGGQTIGVPIIAEIDLYKFDPWELPDKALYGEKEWYFFSPRDRKYPNGSRPNRAAGTGYWKATGADKPIGQPKPLAIKKALVFYAGKAPKGVKTNWIMHEYRLANVDRSAGKKGNLRLDDWVLCRIYNKKGRIERYDPDGTRPNPMTAANTTTEYSEMEEDTKPNISMYSAQNGINWAQHSQSEKTGLEMSHQEASHLERHHTDSSCVSEHVFSPCEKEVQSEAKPGNELTGFEDFDYLMQSFPDDPFAAQVQYQMDQLAPLPDMFTYIPKPF